MSRKENTKRENKIKIIILIIAIIAIIAIVLTLKLVKLNKTKEVNTKINVTNEVENTILNDIPVVNEIKVENSIKNTTVQEEQNTEEISSEEMSIQNIEQEKNDKEKAIEIAKNNWGEDESVYFSIDNNNYLDSDGNYIVQIRDRVTTHEVERCKVNLETGTCTY